MKCILLSVSILLLLPQHTTQACGFWVYPGEYRFWLLQPDLTNEKDLTPFYFAASYLYKGNRYAGKEVYMEQNVNEWYKAVGGKASKKDISDLLYDVTPQVFYENGRSLVKSNSLLRFLLQKGHEEWYRYFVLSKRVEEIAATPDPWDEQVCPIAYTSAVIDSLDQLRRQTNNAFIKLRCAYQVLRLYNYNGQGQLLDSYYDRHVAPTKSSSWIKPAALYQVAISY